MRKEEKVLKNDDKKEKGIDNLTEIELLIYLSHFIIVFAIEI